MSHLKPLIGAIRPASILHKPCLRQQCLRSQARLSSRATRHISNTRRRPAPQASSEEAHDTLDPVTFHRAEESRRAYYKRRSYYSAAGFVFGMVGLWVVATSIDLPQNAAKLDTPVSADGREDPIIEAAKNGGVVVDGNTVPTGTSTVPTFPKVLHYSENPEEIKVGGLEYQLVGLGIRTVSFLNIQVYVLGFYVATDDIATLQAALIKKIDPVATTLVAGEKQELKKRLLDPVQGEKIWNEVLKDNHFKSIFRIVPTRNTDFSHLRDAWVRAVTAKSKIFEEFGDDTFGVSLNQFKGSLGKGLVPKTKEILLARSKDGSVAVWFNGSKEGPLKMGSVQDERISRALWLNYLAGAKVASEAARQSFAEGLMEYVERPVGTVASQVHV